MRWLFNSASCSRAVAIALRASSRVIAHSILCAFIVGCCIVLCCNLSSTCCCCACQRAVAAFVNVLLLLSSTCCCRSSTCCCYVAPFVVVSLLCPFDIPIAFDLFCKCEGGCPEWGKGGLLSQGLCRDLYSVSQFSTKPN